MTIKKILAVIVFALFSGQALADDGFIYGVQMFNRTIDYDMAQQGFGSNMTVRDSTYNSLVGYAAGIDDDILVRGASEYHIMSAQTYRSWGAHGLYGMEDYLFPAFTRHGIKRLDWVLVGTYSGDLGNDRDMSAEIVRVSNDLQGWPPETSRWKIILSKAAGLAKSSFSSVKIKYEIWNEPDINDTSRGINYWLGTLSRYGQMMNEAAEAIHSADAEAEIINGGLVINDANSEAGYMDYAIQALNEGRISMLAIHRHGTIKDFRNSWQAFRVKLSENGIDSKKVILNESGYAIPYGDRSTASQLEQAVHTAGKILAAKAWGLGGAVAFHLGGLSFANGANRDLLYDGDFSLIDFDDGRLTPRIGYYALKAAVKFTKGLSISGSWDVIYEKSDDKDTGFLWGFEGNDGRKTLAAVKYKPTDAQIRDFFAGVSYDIYDTSGDVIQNLGSASENGIIYLVKRLENNSASNAGSNTSEDQTSNIDSNTGSNASDDQTSGNTGNSTNVNTSNDQTGSNTSSDISTSTPTPSSTTTSEDTSADVTPSNSIVPTPSISNDITSSDITDIPIRPSSDALTKIARTLGITSSEITYIPSSSRLAIIEPSASEINTISSDGYEIVSTQASIRAEGAGYYVFPMTVPASLVSTDTSIRVYLAYTGLTAARIFTTSGDEVSTLPGEILAAANINAGTFSTHIAKPKSNTASGNVGGETSGDLNPPLPGTTSTSPTLSDDQTDGGNNTSGNNGGSNSSGNSDNGGSSNNTTGNTPTPSALSKIARRLGTSLNITYIPPSNMSTVSTPSSITRAISSDGYEIVSSQGSLTVSTAGYYTFSMTVPASLVGTNTALKVFLADRGIFTGSVADASSSGLTEAEIFTASGDEVSTLPSTILAAANLNVGTFSTHLAKAASSTGDDNMGGSGGGCETFGAYLGLIFAGLALSLSAKSKH